MLELYKAKRSFCSREWIVYSSKLFENKHKKKPNLEIKNVYRAYDQLIGRITYKNEN